MSYFTPGLELSKVTINSIDEIVFRYPVWQDVVSLTNYINKLSVEDTYLSVSGEVFSLNDEAHYLADKFTQMESGNSVYVFAMKGQQIVGLCNVDRYFQARIRANHRATLGISIDNNFRGMGLGYQLLQITINQARQKISGLKSIQLNLFGSNQAAYNLYKKAGFEEYGRLEKGLMYKGNWDDEVYMNLKF